MPARGFTLRSTATSGAREVADFRARRDRQAVGPADPLDPALGAGDPAVRLQR